MSRVRSTQPRPTSSWTLYRFFLPYLRPYWPHALAACIVLIGGVAMDVLAPWAIKFIFDGVIGGHPIPGIPGSVARRLTGTNRMALLNLILLGFLAVSVLDGIFTYAGSVLLSTIGQKLVFDIRRDLFAHVQKLSLKFHGSTRTGDLVARLTSDIGSIQDMIITVSSSVFVSVLTIALMVTVMLRLDWRYTALSMAVAPFMFVTVQRYRRAIRQTNRQMRDSEGRVNSLVQEVISSIRIVKAFTREDFEQRRFEEQSGTSLQASLRSARLQAQLGPLLEILSVLASVGILWLGVREVLRGQLTAGELLVIMVYFRWMYGPLRQLASISTLMARGMAGVERVHEVLVTVPDLMDLPGAVAAPAFRGRVQYEHVDFAYDGHRRVLRDICLNLEPGSVTALVGATGSGKSTTVSLIPRFYDPSAGIVRIDGQDIRTYTLQSLRAQVSLVLQEAVLFYDTVYNNIACANPNATARQVYAGAEAANALEFIERLPHGYDTIVGERGESLSGGQRQRIAIARAILRDARILILDEPTTGLDAEAEMLVLEALQRLVRDRTTLVIAHHLTTVQRADQIVVLDHGEVVETGTHTSLLMRNSWYARVYRTQTRPLIDVAVPDLT